MKEIIKVNYTNAERPTVLGRDLHKGLDVKTPYDKWIKRMFEYGFEENVDFATMDKNVYRMDGAKMPQTKQDHQLTIDMAKEIAMLQRNEKGKRVRQYFIEVEKQLNSPELTMARALKLADVKMKQLSEKIEEDKPKVIFADAVSSSKTSILVGELAKLLKQNGVNIGQNKLFEYLRDNGYLIKAKRSDHNMPTQRSMDLGLFEIKETAITHSNGHTSVSKTVKVTGKGQQYFINQFLKEV